MLAVFGGGPSSRLLAHRLGCKRNILNAHIIIRWRTTDTYPNKKAYEINPRVAVVNSSHKYASLCIMKDHGLNVPPILMSAIDVESDLAKHPDHIWFGRNNYHSKGTDIVVYSKDTKHTKVSDRHDYFIQYLKPRSEYRYHVAFDKVILPTKKILGEGETDDSLIRNHQDGKWIQVACRETERFSQACIAAVKMHGLHFGAVDFLNIDGKPVMLEINTAPGLQVDNRLDAYAKAIDEFLIKERI